MALIDYTKSFGFASNYQNRLNNQRFQEKIDKLKFKQDDKLGRAHYHEAGGGLFDRMKARRLYRKADRYQAGIDALQKRIVKTED